MDIKDRLNITNILKSGSSRPGSSQTASENKESESVLFDDNETVLGILTEKINSGSNIIYVCPQNCDKKTIASLLKNYVRRNKNVVCPASSAEYVTGAVNFLPEACASELKVVSEFVIYGVSSFVIGLNLNSYENILEKTETLIALNSGISEKYIKILLRELAPIFVYIEKEKDVYIIKSIDKTVIKNSDIELKNIYVYFTGKTPDEITDKETGKSLLPDFKSVLEDTAVQKDNSFEKELILNNPALKNQTDKYSLETENSDAVSENNVNNISEAADSDAVVPSIKNILEDDVSDAEEEILADVVLDDVIISPSGKKDETQDDVIIEEPVDADGFDYNTDDDIPIAEETENIDLTIPVHATPVNKYKALRDKIRTKKEKAAEF